jgi:transcriptional regulator with XRE-family HTH domain
MPLVRTVLGDALRGRRVGQRRTLRDVSRSARVSLGYLSEVERGQKEASSELLAAICEALSVPLSALLREVSEDLATREAAEVAGRAAATGSGALAGALAGQLAGPAVVLLAPPRRGRVAVDRAA